MNSAAQAAQLARIAAMYPPQEDLAGTVYIVELTSPPPHSISSLFHWLCAPHAKARKASGWKVDSKKRAPHSLACDDCKAAG